MVSEPNAHATRDVWLTLAASHMRVAEKLYQTGGGYEIAIFHAYHAFECALCAVIAAEGHALPPDDKSSFQVALTAPVSQNEHDARAKLAAKLITSEKPYHAIYVRLDGRRHWRHESLYIEDDKLPEKRFTQANADWLLQNVALFLSGIWIEIHGQYAASPFVHNPPAIPTEAVSTEEAPAMPAAILPAPAPSTAVLPTEEAPAFAAEEPPYMPEPAMPVEEAPALSWNDMPATSSEAMPMAPEYTPVYSGYTPAYSAEPATAPAYTPAYPVEPATAPAYTPAYPIEPATAPAYTPSYAEEAPAIPDFTPTYSVDPVEDAPSSPAEDAPATPADGRDGI